MKSRFLLALLALGFGSSLLAGDQSGFPNISFVGAGTGKPTVNREQLVALVVEGPFLSCEKNPLPAKGEVDYVNQLLKAKGVTYIGVYTREGVKYGDVVRAIDLLRKTDAKDIGVSLVELAPGREP